MIRYLTGRVLSAAGVLAALVTLVFFATSVIGNPIELLADPEFTSGEEIERLSHQLGYDRPLVERYVDYVAGALRGDFGDSVVQPRAATDLIRERLPATLLLAAAALAIVVMLALPLAILSARSAGWLDGIVTTFSTGFASLPPFWFAIALIYIFAVTLPWLPSGGYGDVRQLALPALALAIVPLGHTTLILQAALRNEFARQYVVVARAKGLRERAIAYRHVLRNAAIVLATQIGLLIIAFMNGTVLIEAVFAWPGLGQLALDSVSARDLPVVMASVIYFGIFVVVVNLAVDLCYAGLDPRVRLS